MSCSVNGGALVLPAGNSGVSISGNLYSSVQMLNSMSVYSGNRFLVVCNGQATELPANATIEQAQDKAEELAHKHQSEAFILKPIRKVAPKRDVTTTDL